jgi:crossover junction endodeoxyribonuclease RuvC
MRSGLFYEQRMRIMGIDPGSRICGWGVVDEAKTGGKLIHVDCGIVAPKARAPLSDRLAQIYDGLRRVIEEYKPDAVGVESVFFAKSVKSALVLGHARGVALLAAAHSGLEVAEYSPAEIKQAVCGYGRADKQQVARMVKAILNQPEVAQTDAADALACAICHCNSRRLKSKLSAKK